jgi:probable phosphoglycerate mutase
MKRIYLLRHAQSEFNEKGIFQGRLDSDLTPLGYVQARMSAHYFEDKGIEVIYTSPQRRALKTALTVGDVLGIEPFVDERLREMSFGYLEGRDFWKLYEEEREMINSWLMDPLSNPLPSQESFENFEKRVLSILEELKESDKRSILVVGHGGTLHALVCLALGIPLSKMWHVHMDNTGVSLLEYDGKFRLAFLNSTCHLVRE